MRAFSSKARLTRTPHEMPLQWGSVWERAPRELDAHQTCSLPFHRRAGLACQPLCPVSFVPEAFHCPLSWVQLALRGDNCGLSLDIIIATTCPQDYMTYQEKSESERAYFPQECPAAQEWLSGGLALSCF